MNADYVDSKQKEIKPYYLVDGGCILELYKTDDLNDAYNEFFKRIKITRPFSGCIIGISKIESLDDLVINCEIIHRVFLN